MTEVSYSLDWLLEQQSEIESKEVGLLGSSLSRLGDGYHHHHHPGSLSLRSNNKRSSSVCGAVAAAEPLLTSCCPFSISATLSVSSLARSPPTKATTLSTTTTSASFPSSFPQKMRNSNNKSGENGHMVKWLNAMRAQSPPRSHISLTGGATIDSSMWRLLNMLHGW